MNGLTVVQTNEALTHYQARYEQKARKISEAVSITIGIISGIVAEIFAIYHLINLDENASDRQVLLAAICVELGGIGAGFGMFGISHYITMFLTAKKVEQIKQERLNIEEAYQENDSVLEPTDIPSLLKLVDDQAKTEMIAEMNFNQLLEARRVLGDKKFKRAIQDVDAEPHQLWKQILALPTEYKTPEQLEKYLSHPNVRQVISANNETWMGIREVFQNNKKMRDIVDQHLFPSIVTKTEKKETVKVKFGETTLELNKDLLSQNSGYFRNFIQGEWKECSADVIDLTELYEEKQADLQPILELLSGKTGTFSEEYINQLIPYTDVFLVGKVHGMIENILIMNNLDHSLEERIQIVSCHPSYQQLRQQLIVSLNQITVNKDNLAQLYGHALKLDSIELKEKLRRFAMKQLHDSLDKNSPDSFTCHHWFQCAVDLGAPLDQIKGVLPPLTPTNFKAQYEIAECYADVEQPEPLTRCILYCRQHVNELKNHLKWKLDEMPTKVAEILFPSPSASSW